VAKKIKEVMARPFNRAELATVPRSEWGGPLVVVRRNGRARQFTHPGTGVVWTSWSPKAAKRDIQTVLGLSMR